MESFSQLVGGQISMSNWVWLLKKSKAFSNYLQFNSFVPIDDISWQHKWLYVDNVNIATLRSYVKPLALEGKMAVGDSGMRIDK